MPGDEAFKLYDTYGLPRDFIEDLAEQPGPALRRRGLRRGDGRPAREGAGRAAFDGKKGEDFTFGVRSASATRCGSAGDVFEGYAETRLKGVPVLALFDDAKKQVDALDGGPNGYVVLARTPFYVEAGGQVSDQGWIETANGGRSRVSRRGAARPGPAARASRRAGVERRFALGDLVTAEVDVDARDATRRNHTGTHLLHAALRKVLGAHVKQAGSLVAPDRLRFDFVHFSRCHAGRAADASSASSTRRSSRTRR